MPVATNNCRQADFQLKSNQPLCKSSNIPRPMKQLLLDQQLNHASKPLRDILPRTPAAKIINNQNLTKNERKPLMPRMSQLQDVDPEVAVLELTPFCRQPIVNFGQVPVDTTQTRTVVLRNSQDCQQQLFVITFPKASKGLYIDATEFLIAARTETSVTIAWTPKNVESIRETVTFQDINRMPRRIVVLGTAFKPKPEVTKSTTTKNIPRSLYRFNRVPNKLSPNKSNRRIHQERTQLIFSPASKRLSGSRLHNATIDNKPLTKLTQDSRRRQSALMVRKILSQFDESMATKVQTYCRMVLARRQLVDLRKRKEAAIKIQSFARMVIEKRRVAQIRAQIREAQLMKQRWDAAVVLQSYWRTKVHQKNYNNLRRAILIAQTLWRVVLAKRTLIDLKNRRDTVVRLQSYVRMILARRRYIILRTESRSATCIQSHWRAYKVQREYRKLHRATIVLQSQWRMKLAMKRLIELREEHDIVIKIQSYVRMIHAQREYAILKERNEAVIVIQSYWKRYITRRRYLRTRESVIVFQARWRGMLARQKLARLKALVATIVRIQTYGRGMILRRRLQRSIYALQNCQNMASKRLCTFVQQ